jgi:hypothetical protein
MEEIFPSGLLCDIINEHLQHTLLSKDDTLTLRDAQSTWLHYNRGRGFEWIKGIQQTVAVFESSSLHVYDGT